MIPTFLLHILISTTMATKKKSTPKKKAAPKKKAVVKKAPAKKSEDTIVRMTFVKETKKGKQEFEGDLIRKLNYKGTEYFLIKLDNGTKKYMNAKHWVGEA